MTILTDYQIEAWAIRGGIIPYSPRLLNPASIDLTLGNAWRDLAYNPNKELLLQSVVLYPKSAKIDLWNWFATKLPLQRKFTMILGTTFEVIHLYDDMAAEMKLKTTPCREGLGHPIADWVDPGFKGQLTLMLHAFKPIRLYAGETVCQLVIHSLEDKCVRSYSARGHYMNQSGPTLSWKEQKHGSK